MCALLCIKKKKKKQMAKSNCGRITQVNPTYTVFGVILVYYYQVFVMSLCNFYFVQDSNRNSFNNPYQPFSMYCFLIINIVNNY